MKLFLEKMFSNIWAAISAIVVIIILVGSALTVVTMLTSRAEAQEVSTEVATVTEAVEQEAAEQVEKPVRICNISVRGESRWDFDMLLATAEKYGCKVSVDPTPLDQ